MNSQAREREIIPITDWPEEERKVAVIARMTVDRADYKKLDSNGGV